MMSTDMIDALGILTVDYSKSLQEMIAPGHYDWINPSITPKRFPISGTSDVQFEVKLFHFDRFISSEEAVEAIKAEDPQRPWEPAQIEALLAYGAQNPDEQRKYPIIALGSVAELSGHRSVPCLNRSGDDGRDLYLYWWDSGCYDGCRFLAVRTRISAHSHCSTEPVQYMIDCDANPCVPKGWKVEEHQKGGVFNWDASKVDLYLDPG